MDLYYHVCSYCNLRLASISRGEEMHASGGAKVWRSCAWILLHCNTVAYGGWLGAQNGAARDMLYTT